MPNNFRLLLFLLGLIRCGTLFAQEDHKFHSTFLPAFGYTLQTNWAGVINYNLGFYNGDSTKDEQKISSLNTSLTYTFNKQVILPFQANIWSKDKKYNFTTDLRYLQYPSVTYGLGTRTSLDNESDINYNYLKLHAMVSREITRNFYAGAGVFYDSYWNIVELNKSSIMSSFERYGFSSKEKAAGLAFRLLYDSRHNQINPDGGWYGNIIYRPNFVALGSDTHWESILLEGRKYFKPSKSSNNILAFWTYNLFTFSGKPPYLLLPSTGWDDFYNTGRGYIQGRYRGRNMMYLESEYRFGITHNRFLGGVVFANAQSFSKDIQSELSVIAPGYGAGLRFKINKHTNTNICIDYAFGTDGSKGIFVNLGEVF